MRPHILPALSLLSLVSTYQQGMAKGWEFDCKYDLFAQTLKGPQKTDFAMRFNFDDITNKAVVVGNNGVSDATAYRGRLPSLSSSPWSRVLCRRQPSPSRRV